MSYLRALLDWLVRSPWRAFIVLFLLALTIRLSNPSEIPTEAFSPNRERELGAIVFSLEQTGEFADPYLLPTGPTAHIAPVYPYLLSLISRLTGLLSNAGDMKMLLLVLVGSLLVAMLPWFSDRFGLGRQAGFIAGLAWAWNISWPDYGEYLAGFVIGLLLVAFLHRWTGYRITWQASLLLGLGVGVALHLQPAILTVVLGCLAFELCWGRRRLQRTYLGVLILAALLACLPWAWRNYKTFDTLVFIRSNFGLELRMGNSPGALATFEEMDVQGHYLHPRVDINEARKMQDLGEIEYMRGAQRDALTWIVSHPAEFLWLTLQRIANVWIGPIHRPLGIPPVLGLTILAILGLWRSFRAISIPQRAALIIPLVTYPFTYYFFAYMPRYRQPIDWILVVLAGAAVWSWLAPKPETRRTMPDDFPDGQPAPPRGRFLWFMLGSLGIALIVFAFAAFTWRNIPAFQAAIDTCSSPFCDFTTFYYPMGTTVLLSGTLLKGFMYSPFIAILLAIFTPLAINTSILLWGILQACCIVLYLLLFRWHVPADLRFQLLFVLIALTSFPLWHNLSWGQVGVITTVSILGMLALLERNRRLSAAALLSFAAGFKFFPLIFLAPFAFRRNYRFLLLTALVCVVCFVVVPGLMLGPTHTLSFYQSLLASFRLSEWVVSNYNSQYFPHVLLRLSELLGFSARPYLPLLSVFSFSIAALNLLLVYHIQRVRLPLADLWSVHLLFLSIPFFLKTSWPVDLVYLSFAQVFLVWQLMEADTTQSGAGRKRLSTGVMLALVVVSIGLSNIITFDLIGNYERYGFLGFIFWADLLCLIASYLLILRSKPVSD